MKLKKLMALALSGVLAVSMLAGCNGNKAPVDDGTDPIEPGTNGVSTEVGTLTADYLDPTEIPEYVTFADDADLDSSLQYVVEFAGVDDVLLQYMHNDNLHRVAGDLYSRLQKAVGDDNWVNWNSIGSLAALKRAEAENSYKIDDETVVELFAVSSAIGENAVNQLIAEELADEARIQGYLYSTSGRGENGNYNHEYTVSVSTYTKAVNSSSVLGSGAADPAVTFVAVQVVRTSTHQ